MNPIKPTLKTEIIPIIFIALAAASSYYFYNHFPERVPVHWDINGRPNGWGSRAEGAFAIPIVSLVMYFVFFLIPFLDPKKDRYEQFGKAYHVFKGVLVSFMSLLYFFASMNALGYNYRIDILVPVMIGILFIVIGNYMSKIKPNWFMGIRTPWTLSSEENWNKTHRLGAKIFVIGGVLMMGMPFYSSLVRIVMFVIIIAAMTLGTIGYSLYLYLKNKNGNNK